jgi:hypothetical protein
VDVGVVERDGAVGGGLLVEVVALAADPDEAAEVVAAAAHAFADEQVDVIGDGASSAGSGNGRSSRMGAVAPRAVRTDRPARGSPPARPLHARQAVGGTQNELSG